MSLYKLEKPDYSGIGIDIVPNLLRLLEQSEDIRNLINKINHPKYLYWDRVKYLPHPDNISAEELWFLAKHLRKRTLDRSDAVIKAEDGTNFSWRSLPQMEKVLHEIDMTFSDGPSPIPDEDRDIRKKLELQQLREEAIASSQIEGAITSRNDANQLILEQKKSLNNSEQMIFNSYNTMLKLKSDFVDTNLNMNLLFELHRSITENTIAENEIGRCRTNSDNVTVLNRDNGTIYHIPPDEEFLKQEIKRLIDYANDELNDSVYVHPVIKAIFLHFWIGYLHPFTDGNGRLARVLFNWYLLRHDYWIFPYHALSKAIKNSIGQYRDAYIYSEQDDSDLTYFVDYIIKKITLAQRDLESEIAKDKAEKNAISNIASNYNLNNRQIRLLIYYRNNKNGFATFITHKNTYKISRLTAMKDLRGLEKLGFLTSKKIGREIHFYATDKISELV